MAASRRLLAGQGGEDDAGILSEYVIEIRADLLDQRAVGVPVDSQRRSQPLRCLGTAKPRSHGLALHSLYVDERTMLAAAVVEDIEASLGRRGHGVLQTAWRARQQSA